LPELGWFVAQKRKQELDRSVQKVGRNFKESATIEKFMSCQKVVAT
jgi:hypothetical protein